MVPFPVPANRTSTGTELVDAAVKWLRARLPSNWSAERNGLRGRDRGTARPLDAAVSLKAPNGELTTFAVEAKRSLTPRDVDRMLGVTRVMRELATNTPILVVAPWLSVRTQELLEAEEINFIDLTGNARVSLEDPALFVGSTGADRNPEPLPRGQARGRGPKAGRLVRLLADVRPPYGVGELAAAAELAPGYVSRLLDTLDREGLVDRSRRGAVESVDVPGVLRRWAESYDVLKANRSETFLGPTGVAQALDELRELTRTPPFAITGSFAAVRLAPVAAPALLLLYCADPAPLVDALNLLPADSGANVCLLRPFDAVVWARTREAEGLRYVAPSQASIDCLTGPGRMPSEGQALLDWMKENEGSWRLRSLDDAAAAGDSE